MIAVVGSGRVGASRLRVTRPARGVGWTL